MYHLLVFGDRVELDNTVFSEDSGGAKYLSKGHVGLGVKKSKDKNGFTSDVLGMIMWFQIAVKNTGVRIISSRKATPKAGGVKFNF